MSCPETADSLNPYLDDELDPSRRAAFEQHLRGCRECTRELDAMRALRAGLRQRDFRFAAPAGLRERVRSVLAPPAAPAPPRQSLMPWLAAASLLLAALGLASAGYLAFSRPNAGPDLPREVASAHVRSLLAEHLFDIPSTDRHTVKPWFQGKVDFSLPVKDFKDQEYPLEGGRLDYLDDRPVAALVYRRHKHVINLFVWPAADGDSAVQMALQRGYNLAHWDQGGLHFWAVSDLNEQELAEFARLQRESPQINPKYVELASAYSSLSDALKSLKAADPKFGGHRKTAIDLVNQAMGEVQAASDFRDGK